MKKTILLSSFFAVTAAVASTVTSENAVGALNISIAADAEKLVAVPFEGYDGSAVKVNEMLKTNGLGTGSKLYVAKSGGYDVWTLSETGQWEPDTTVTDGVQGESASATSASVGRGNAFWLEAKSTGTAYLLGQKPASDSVEVTAAQGMNLIGNPKIVEGDVLAAIQSPGNGDELTVADAKGYQKKYTYSTAKGGWCCRNGGNIEKITELELEAGESCWLNAKAARTVKW